MSLNFSSPALLFGLLGISIPVLIHLLTRRQQKHVQFSAVYLLFQSQKRSIKKSNPNRLLLLFLRCMGIALFSLALANPFFSFGDSEAFRASSPASYVFIMDDSFSMRSQAKEKTLFQSATQFLSSLLTQTPEGSEFSLVLASSPARIDQDWIEQTDTFEKLVNGLQASYRTTDIGKAMEKTISLLDASNKKNKKIILFTDLDKNGWKKESFTEIEDHSGFPVQVFDFSGQALGKNQVAVQNVQTSQEFLTSSRILRIKADIKNLSHTMHRLSVSLIVDKKVEKEILINIPAGQKTTKEFSFPLHKGNPIHGVIKAGEDMLTVDDTRYFSYHPNQNIKVLVVDGDPDTISHQSESFYLERALNPFSVSVSHIDPTVSTLAELPSRKLSDFSVVILANVRELPLDYELELEKFVLHGGALIFGMGDQIDPRYYNEKLGNLFPVNLEARQDLGNVPIHLLLEKNDHPVMKAFSTKTIAEMKEIGFHSIYTIQAREGKNFRVASWFTNQNPAVLETDSGKGKVIIFLSSLDRDWNEFPIQPTFLPWIQRWTQYAALGLENISHQDLLIGENFQQNIDQQEGEWAVQTPGGNLHLLEMADDQVIFTNTYAPGIYTIFKLPRTNSLASGARIIPKLPLGSLPVGTFTVNVDTEESHPEKISEEEIKKLLPNMKVEIMSPEINLSRAPSSDGVPLATPFFLLVAGILLLEGWMLRRE